MQKKVRDFIEKNQMLEPGERVIVALSGGADSVGLLVVLTELFDLELKAVHVHHGLRGAEADRDAAFAEDLCRRLEIPFTLVCRDVKAYAERERISTEEAGRVLRYEALEEEADAWGAVKIALAHHSDDNAETILHHLLRGSGLKGLGGMKPVQGDRIRPLLCVGKDEIREYLTERGFTWCEDSTNESDGYTRNRIRNQILPLLKETINQQAVEHILKAGAFLADADGYLERTACGIWQQSGVCGNGQSRISLEVLTAQEPVIRTYLLRHMIELVTDGQKDVASCHYEQMDQLLFKRGPGRCDLPGGWTAVRGYEDFRIEKKAECEIPASGKPEREEAALPRPGQGPIWLQNMEIQAFYREKAMEIPKNQYTKWFDYDRIRGVLSAGSRRPGDYLELPGGGTKTVARYMIDEKIPKERRENIPVLADDEQVLWIVGYRINEYYKITDDTRCILQVSVDRGEDHGR